MRNATEDDLTNAVLEKLAGAQDARFREIMASLVRHLHGFIRETGVTDEEWAAGIRFLTAVGHKCD